MKTTISNIIKSTRNYNFFKKPSVVLGIYLFIILLFAFLYWYLNISFNKAGKLTELCFSDSLYFSVVTITTLGYGDISPSGGIGKLLTGSEAVFGILILGLYLNSLSHSLAINYQNKLKEKESEMAIKLLYVPNWYDINQYLWHLIDADKALSKVKLLQQQASESTEEQLISFKESLKIFNIHSNIHNFQGLEKDKERSISHLNKFFGMVDPVKHQKLLYHISVLRSEKLHLLTKNFIGNMKNELKNSDRAEHTLTVTSVNLQHIDEWLKPELASMRHIICELNDITGVKNKTNADGSRYYG